MAHEILTDTAAIDKAISSLESKAKYLETPISIRLEEVQRSGDTWVVLLSYLTDSEAQHDENPLVRALSRVRKYKEFAIDASSGEFISMKDPVAAR